MSDKEEEITVEEIEIKDLIAEEPTRKPIEEEKEVAAKNLAYLLAVVFLAVVLFPLGYFLFTAQIPKELFEYTQVILAPITTLLGIAFGFYFSREKL